MKKLTNKWFKDHNACSDGYKWVLTRKDITVKGTIKELIKIDKLDWANWTIARVFNRKQRIQYAVYAAKQVLKNFEKEFPEDKRPREAINAAIKCINNNTAKNRSAARSAESAAWSATESAESAAWSAAESAAWSAWSATESAESAAWSAESAARSAESAARSAESAAWSATESAESAAKKKILQYGLKLLED